MTVIGERLNRQQRMAVAVGMSAVVLFVVFPPWRSTNAYPGMTVSRFEGYAFLLSPPIARAVNRFSSVEIDSTRLIAQSLLDALLTAGAVILLGRTER